MNIFGLFVHFAAGAALGIFYFGGLWWNTRRFVDGGRLGTMILVTLGRFGLLGALLTLASFEGAMPLLIMVLGILAARSLVMSRVRAL